ncbi:MAG: hypothetical protein RL721_2347 [Candidatus Eisenbacteria bacterium]
MKLPILLTLAALCLAGPVSAASISGTILRADGQPMYPCDIDVIDRVTGLNVPNTNDSTLANGTYSMTIPNGRYDVYFKPPQGAHIFQGIYLNMRIETNVILNAVLPFGKRPT